MDKPVFMSQPNYTDLEIAHRLRSQTILQIILSISNARQTHPQLRELGHKLHRRINRLLQ